MDRTLKALGIIYEDAYSIKLANVNISERGKDWVNFALKVLNHVEDYTVSQYGDKGEDQCTEFTIEDFKTQIKKYVNRMGKNSREGQDKLDLLKICHYCQMLTDKLESEEDRKDKEE